MPYSKEFESFPLGQILSFLEVACQTFSIAVLTKNINISGALLCLVELDDGGMMGELHVDNFILDLFHECLWVVLRGDFLEVDDFVGTGQSFVLVEAEVDISESSFSKFVGLRV